MHLTGCALYLCDPKPQSQHITYMNTNIPLKFKMVFEKPTLIWNYRGSRALLLDESHKSIYMMYPGSMKIYKELELCIGGGL